MRASDLYGTACTTTPSLRVMSTRGTSDRRSPCVPLVNYAAPGDVTRRSVGPRDATRHAVRPRVPRKWSGLRLRDTCVRRGIFSASQAAKMTKQLKVTKGHGGGSVGGHTWSVVQLILVCVAFVAAFSAHSTNAKHARNDIIRTRSTLLETMTLKAVDLFLSIYKPSCCNHATATWIKYWHNY